MTQEETALWVMRLMAEGRIHDFYLSTQWTHLRDSVMDAFRGECQWCKARGLYVPAELVHHMRPVREFPALALSRTYEIGGIQYVNLVPLCKPCHERAHPHRLRGEPKPPLTVERW